MSCFEDNEQTDSKRMSFILLGLALNTLVLLFFIGLGFYFVAPASSLFGVTVMLVSVCLAGFAVRVLSKDTLDES